MVTLGASLSHDGTLSVVCDGKLSFSLAEERLNRIKSYIGFPFQSLRYAIEHGVIDPSGVSSMAIPMNHFTRDLAWEAGFLLTEDKLYYDLQNEPQPHDFYLGDRDWQSVDSGHACKVYVERKIRRILESVGISAPIRFVNHHLAHAASAYYASGQNVALAITLDGEGDNLSGSVSICRDGKIRTIHTEPVHASLGYLYSYVTRRCGFKISRHEGKITGLAAYGDHEKTAPCFAKEVSVENGAIRYQRLPASFIQKATFRLNTFLRRRSKSSHWESIIEECGADLSREDLAAAVQHLLEERIIQYARFWMDHTNIRDLVVAGGVFANVKINQALGELPETKSLFVFPDMGDGGGAYGAAAIVYHREHEFRHNESRLDDVYLGPSYSNRQIASILETQSEVSYHHSDHVEAEAANLIHKNNIVGWFQGRMEYGPRALGNRSILARATDHTITDRLNLRLDRSEFMPFAPSCVYETATDVFDIPNEELKRPAEFMTITFGLKAEWARKLPAIAHIDQTARPHFVKREVNPKFYKLLHEYQGISAVPLLLNTSFNVHEEPIVCHPREAISALKNGAVDFLILGDFVCRKMATEA